MAVPGPVTSPTSVGCHEMVRSGMATLVTRPAEIIELIGPLGTAPPPLVAGARRDTDELDGNAKRVHDTLTGYEHASAEELARDSGLPLRKVRALLPTLEIAGLVSRDELGWTRRKGGGSAHS